MVANKDALKQEKNTYKKIFFKKENIVILIQIKSYTLEFPMVLHIGHVRFNPKISNKKRKREKWNNSKQRSIKTTKNYIQNKQF